MVVVVLGTQEQEMDTNLNYPAEWNELSKYERRKKLKELIRQKERKVRLFKKVFNIGLVIVTISALIVVYKLTTKKAPEQIEFEQKIEAVSLEGKVEEFAIEGRNHVPSGTKVEYKTNPPTSGSHYANPAAWGAYNKEVVDESVVHSLEHGGIWISYKDISEEEKKILEEIGKANLQSVIVSPRLANDVKIAIVSWGRMMEPELADKALIQKYIDTYKNQSPEKLAR